MQKRENLRQIFVIIDLSIFRYLIINSNRCAHLIGSLFTNSSEKRMQWRNVTQENIHVIMVFLNLTTSVTMCGRRSVGIERCQIGLWKKYEKEILRAILFILNEYLTFSYLPML